MLLRVGEYLDSGQELVEGYGVVEAGAVCVVVWNGYSYLQGLRVLLLNKYHRLQSIHFLYAPVARSHNALPISAAVPRVLGRQILKQVDSVFKYFGEYLGNAHDFPFRSQSE